MKVVLGATLLLLLFDAPENQEYKVNTSNGQLLLNNTGKS